MAEGSTGSPARGQSSAPPPPSGGLSTGFIVVAVLLAFAGASRPPRVLPCSSFPRQPWSGEEIRREARPNTCRARTRRDVAPTVHPIVKNAGADVFATFKGAEQHTDAVTSAPVDPHSLGGKVHISFCQS